MYDPPVGIPYAHVNTPSWHHLGSHPRRPGSSSEESEQCDNSALGISAPAVRVEKYAQSPGCELWRNKPCCSASLGGFGRFWEDKLCLGDHCYELAFGVGDPRLPYHGSAPAVQGCSFTNDSRAHWRGADEVGLAFDRGSAAPLGEVCQRSERTQRVCKRHESPAVQHIRPGA